MACREMPLRTVMCFMGLRMAISVRDGLWRGEGMVLGRAEGLAEGQAEGREEGRAEGLAEGRRAAMIEMAKALLETGMSKDQIISMTGLDEAEMP